MADKVSVYVQEVESVAAEHAVCVVRALEGTTSIGQVFNAFVDSTGDRASVSIRVDKIWRYGRETDILDPAHTARLEVSGSGLDRLRSSGVLT
ncbi:hypothetical protein [Amycolatopsis sp. NPDC004079]|uniref:hypothetical protein n=1 Tax=Amycolatopsis sp. NPDC004079 TaxID=3154549 RepID=UPI0033A9551D